MFTGIIEEIGTVRSVKAGTRSATIVIGANRVIEDMKIGDSINTDGICLTVTAFSGDTFTVDVMPETMKRSGLQGIKAGTRVNLERALRLSDRLGGHLVSGHGDDTGKILNKRVDENATWLTIGAGKNVLKYIVEKGSVALDGISLTVARVDERSFEVSIIPHTRSETTLVDKNPGQRVNIECDMIAKYLEKLQQTDTKKNTLDLGFLTEQGFI
jgi:riboflavin synthase